MITVQVEKLKEKLATLITPQNLALIAGKEVEVQHNVFIKLMGGLDFSIQSSSDGILVKFKIKPQIRVVKLLTLYGELTSAKVTKDGVYLDVDGLPDIFLEAIS